MPTRAARFTGFNRSDNRCASGSLRDAHFPLHILTHLSPSPPPFGERGLIHFFFPNMVSCVKNRKRSRFRVSEG